MLETDSGFTSDNGSAVFLHVALENCRKLLSFSCTQAPCMQAHPDTWREAFSRMTRQQQDACRRYVRRALETDSGFTSDNGSAMVLPALATNGTSTLASVAAASSAFNGAGWGGPDSLGRGNGIILDSDESDSSESDYGFSEMESGGAGFATAKDAAAGVSRGSVRAMAAPREEGLLLPNADASPLHGEDPLQGRRVLQDWQANASLVRSLPLEDLPLVFVPLVRRVGADGPADVLTVDISLEPPRRDLIAVVFEDVHDACALVALLGHTSGYTTADGVQRSVVGMPPQTAVENAAKAGAAVVCYAAGFAAKARVRVGCELRDVLDAIAGARRAAQIEEIRQRDSTV
jgi:hypothetical protein